MKSVRTSKLGLALACPPSQVPPTVPIEGDDGPARLGTATHKGVAAFIAGEPFDSEQAAAEYDVDPDELGRLIGFAINCWRDRLAAWFPDPMLEAELSWSTGNLTLTGHPDVYSLIGPELRIGDWKTGRVDADATQQLRGYAWLLLQRHAEAETVAAFKIDLRRGELVPIPQWTRGQYAAWWRGVESRLLEDGSAAYRPGADTCRYCPRALECPAHARQLRSMALAFTDPEAPLIGGVDELSPAELLDALQFSKVLAGRCGDFRQAVEARVLAAGGRLGRLTMVEKDRTAVDVWAGWGVLQEVLGNHLLPLLKIAKDPLEKAVKTTAPRGQKGTAIKDFYDRLDAAGAMTRTTSLVLEIMPDGNNHPDTPEIGTVPSAQPSPEAVSG